MMEPQKSDQTALPASAPTEQPLPADQPLVTKSDPMDALRAGIPVAIARFLPIKGTQINASAQQETIRYWYEQNAPTLEPLGLSEHSPTIRQALLSTFKDDPHAASGSVFQSGLAAALQNAYNLPGQTLAILAGGIPLHPLSPSPEKVKVYSDAMMDVVKRAQEIGYNARLVEIGNAPDLQRLSGDGIENVIMTGVAYQQDDDALAEMLRRLGLAGVKRMFLNYSTPHHNQETIERLRARGWKAFLRTPDDAWKIATMARIPNMMVIDGWRLLPFFPEPAISLKLSEEGAYLYHLIVAYCFNPEIPSIAVPKAAADAPSKPGE